MSDNIRGYWQNWGSDLDLSFCPLCQAGGLQEDALVASMSSLWRKGRGHLLLTSASPCPLYLLL